MEQLKIRGFGPIREAVIDVKDFMIFTEGGHIEGKLLYIFNSLREEVFRTVYDTVEGIHVDPLPEGVLKGHIISKLKDFFPKLKKGYVISYDYGNGKSISIKGGEVSYSDTLQQAIRDIFAFMQQYLMQGMRPSNTDFLKALEAYLVPLFGEEKEPVYVKTEEDTVFFKEALELEEGYFLVIEEPAEKWIPVIHKLVQKKGNQVIVMTTNPARLYSPGKTLLQR